jgi:hypothetical protein
MGTASPVDSSNETGWSSAPSRCLGGDRRHFRVSSARDAPGGHCRETFPTGKRCTPLSATGAKTGHGSRCMTACAPGSEWTIAEKRVLGKRLWIVKVSFIAALVSRAVGYDAAKLVLGRKRHLRVDALGLVRRVLVTAASVPERQGGKQVLKQVKQIRARVFRLHPVWALCG